MSWLSEIFTSSVGTVVDSVGDAIDSLVTSDEEKLLLKNELVKIQLEASKKAEELSIEAEKEITKRWTSDNEHTVTRLVRPISYSAVLVLFGAVVLTDGNIGQFTIRDGYITVLETLLSTMTVAYFGSRGLEKTMKHFKGKQ